MSDAANAVLISTGFVSILNGPSTLTIALKGPPTLLGSRHESEHVPPQPYSRLNVLSYDLSALVIYTLGAEA